MLGTVSLLIFHLAFFRRFYFKNSFIYATGEPLEIEFSSSRYLGECLRRWKFPHQDPYHFPYYTSLPILSSFYPPHMIMSVIQSFLTINVAWKVFSITSVFHYLWASLGAYLLFSRFSPWVAFFGAITLTHMGYSVKQNAPIIYTLSWIPWVLYGANLHNPWIMGVSLGMMTLAGYWPLALYLWPISGFYWLTQ